MRKWLIAVSIVLALPLLAYAQVGTNVNVVLAKVVTDILTSIDGHVDQLEGYLDGVEGSLTTIAGLMTGASSKTHTSVGITEDKFTVKSSPGTLYSVTATNTNAEAAYFRCNNDSSVNTTPGSETEGGTLMLDLAIPGGTSASGYHVAFPQGAAFSTALVCWIVTGKALTDPTEVTADEVKVFITYK